MTQHLSNPSDLSHQIPTLIPRRHKDTISLQSIEPPPETPTLPAPPNIDISSFDFILPCKQILSPKHLELFQASESYTLVLAFIFGISDSVHHTKISQYNTVTQPQIIKTLLNQLYKAKTLVSSYPPLDTGSRFGNPAFISWLHHIRSLMKEWHEDLNVPKQAVTEISEYFAESFGNESRLDYGSGHELNFFLWLLCLNRINLLPTSAYQALALQILPAYLDLMRHVQMTYYLEPAGSHGVWGLDDYQFLPFLFGASQLAKHPFLRPKSIHNQVTVDECSKDYLYFNQVNFVNSTKTVQGLRWHSPMLDDISGAKSWEKVEGGMKKMFVKEVLGKLPVMQHFLFGSLIPKVEKISQDQDIEVSGHDESHNHINHNHQQGSNNWSDCCGIPVPSSLGAAGEIKKGSKDLRRIPFD